VVVVVARFAFVGAAHGGGVKALICKTPILLLLLLLFLLLLFLLLLLYLPPY